MRENPNQEEEGFVKGSAWGDGRRTFTLNAEGKKKQEEKREICRTEEDIIEERERKKTPAAGKEGLWKIGEGGVSRVTRETKKK